MRTINRISNIICIIVIAAMACLLVLKWNSLPEEVPTHFTFDGTPDGFGSKTALITNTVIATVLYVLISVAQRFPQIWNYPVELTAKNKEKEYLIASVIINAEKVLITLLFLMSLLSALITGFTTWPMIVCIVLALAVPIAGIVLMIRLR